MIVILAKEKLSALCMCIIHRFLLYSKTHLLYACFCVRLCADAFYFADSTWFLTKLWLGMEVKTPSRKGIKEQHIFESMSKYIFINRCFTILTA